MEFYNSQVKASCITMDDVKAYVDKNIDTLKTFIADVIKKLPVPVRFDPSGIGNIYTHPLTRTHMYTLMLTVIIMHITAIRTLKLHFECGLKKGRCRFTNVAEDPDSTFTTQTTDIAKWLKVGT